jgi:hypothetical protein
MTIISPGGAKGEMDVHLGAVFEVKKELRDE